MFVEPEQLAADRPLQLAEETEHHLRRVLRLRDGAPVSITDGVGRWRLAAVNTGSGSFQIEPTSVVQTEQRGAEVDVAVVTPKGERVDWLVQKVTELGADRIVLLEAEHSVVRWKPERANKQLQRLQRIADEACRQSRRVWRLEVTGPVQAASVLASYVVAEPGGRRISSGDTAIAIGPEGGWSATELELAAGRIDLGPNILRTETAAVAATTLCVGFER